MGMAEVNGFRYSLYSIAPGNPNGVEEGDSLILNKTWVIASSEEYRAIALGDIPAQ